MTIIQRLTQHLPWFLRRGATCQHAQDLQPVTPNSDGCEACRELGDTWYHLRICMTCGTVACCDNSKNKHATAHHHDARHPVIRSFQPGETWLWCYLDEQMMQDQRTGR